jgi:hypothetical protein
MDETAIGSVRAFPQLFAAYAALRRAFSALGYSFVTGPGVET